MTDQTPRPESNVKPSSFLSEADRRRLENLTARGEARFRADAQSQAVLERAKRLFRLCFMRLDHGRWRVSKTKGLAFALAGAAALAFWSYYPRPQLATVLEMPGLPIGSSNSPTPQPMPARQAQPTESRPKVAVTAPPRLPAPRLEPPPVITTVPAAPASPSAPAYKPYQNELVRPAPNTAAVSVRQPPAFTGWGTNADMTPLPVFRETRTVARTPSGVAPAPTPLVRSQPVSSIAPKPLVDREASGDFSLPEATTGAELRGDGPSLDASSAAGSGDVAPLVNRSNAAADALGQAGVLVDASRPDGASEKPAGPSGSASGERGAAGGALFDVNRAAPRAPVANPATNPTATVSQASSPYQPGARLGAKLAVGVIAVQGQESPMVAQLEDGVLAFGRASLESNGRVRLTLLEVVRNGGSSAVNGSALGADGFPGLATEVLDDGPDVVGQLWQAGLQGVSSYAQSVIQGATTTVAGGATTVSGPQPNLGLSLLQGLAQTFLNPQGQPSVKYARLEPGTPFQILILPAR